MSQCEYDGCSNEAKYFDAMDNVVCESCMIREIEENGEEPEDFELIDSNDEPDTPTDGYSVTMEGCPFCGDVPELPSGDGTQYEIICDCGKAQSCVQISDLMTKEERHNDHFINHRFGEEYIERAKREAIKNWNQRI